MIKHRLQQYFIKAALISGCFFFYACENDPKVIAEWTGTKKMVEEGDSIITYMSQGSTMKAKLTAPYMIRSQSDTVYVEFPRSLDVDFFDSTGKVESHLDAKYGKYYESLNKVYLRDSVVVYNMQGDTLNTPDLWWDQNLQKFYTDKNVRVRKGGNLIFGKGMDAQQDLTNINIRQVSGLVAVPDSLQPR
ncbi:MAG: LPS export ABC transporter periplasmic protein LptC [Flavisolibacter sp.]|jgi:LPS export ABC transporter protein LptC